MVLSVEGAGSVLDLSSLTTFTGQTGNSTGLVGLMDILATNGGFLDLSHVGGSIYGFARFHADGANSVIDISEITDFSGYDAYDNSNGQYVIPSLQTSNGGTMRMGHLTNLFEVDLYVGGSIDIAQLVTFAYGSITVDGVSANFASLVGSFSYDPGPLYGNNFTVTNWLGEVFLPNVNELHFNSLSVNNDAILQLPSVRTLNVSNLSADGSGSVMDLSSATTWAGYTISASNGGEINLNGLASLPQALSVSAAPNYSDPNIYYYSGGEIDLQSVGSFDGVNFVVQSGGSLNLDPGSVLLSNSSIVLDDSGSYGASISVGSLVIGQGSSSSGIGAIFGGVVNDSAVGFSSLGGGGLAILGTFEQSSTGSLAVALEDGSIDGEISAGSDFIDGTLEVSLANDFQPQAGDSFVVLLGGFVSGTFANVYLPDLLGDLVWTVSYDPGDVTLSVGHSESMMVSALCAPGGEAAGLTASAVLMSLSASLVPEVSPKRVISIAPAPAFEPKRQNLVAVSMISNSSNQTMPKATVRLPARQVDSALADFDWFDVLPGRAFGQRDRLRALSASRSHDLTWSRLSEDTKTTITVCPKSTNRSAPSNSRSSSSKRSCEERSRGTFDCIPYQILGSITL